MKKLLIIAVLAISFALPILNSPSVFAHELLPKNVVQYIQNNPNATPDQIKQYIKNEAPEFSDKVKSQQNVIDLVNQKTNFFDNAFDFLKLGVKHILSGPDHILFVLSLLLVFSAIKTILKYTGAFTLAHSITLILAGSGALVLSSKIVEPMIALSIAVVALISGFLSHNKYFADVRTKMAIIFFFGLFHGLGFAGLLQEIRIPDDKFIASLVSFNIGIEIGQLIIVGLALPFIYLLRNKPWYPLAVKIAAVVIASIASVWFFQRLFA